MHDVRSGGSRGIPDVRGRLEAAIGEAGEEELTFTHNSGLDLPEAMRVLERGFTAATQFYAFPEPRWARLRTTNSLERLHTEIKRRIRSAGAFPDRASALRLITAVALRTTAVWSERRYLDLSLLEPKEVAKAAYPKHRGASSHFYTQLGT